jgi:hypothetical protein
MSEKPIAGRVPVVVGDDANGWQIHDSDVRRSTVLNSDGKWESYRGENLKFPTEAAALAFARECAAREAGVERLAKENAELRERNDTLLEKPLQANDAAAK